jgi:hypothetical protein
MVAVLSSARRTAALVISEVVVAWRAISATLLVISSIADAIEVS